MNRITADIPDLHRNLQRLVRAALGEGLKSLFNDVEKRLFNRAEHTLDDDSRQDFFDAVASLKQKRQLFEQNLLETLEQPDLPQRVPSDWNALVNNRNLALHIEDIIAQAKARFGIEHAQYEARIAWMNQQDPANVPAGIYTLQNLTTGFILNLDLFPESAREGLIRALGNHLLNKLEPLYVLLNDYLIQAGILTRVRSVRSSAAPAGGMADNDIQEVLASMEMIEPTILSGAELRAAIYKMTDQGKRPSIVDSIDGWEPQLLQESITAYLRSNGENTRIDPEELESIKLVGLLFSTIMNDQKVRLSVRQKILSLQWPVMNVALRERGFFRHASHPARDVPNLCALIGSDPNSSKETLIELGRIIDRIIINHENDAKTFERARDELKHIEHPEQQPTADEAETQSADAPSHDEMLQRCQQRVNETINTRVAEHALTGMRILPETRAFIENIINSAMVVSLINYGRNSQPWQKALDTLDHALALQSQPNARECTAFHKKTWDLLELVDQGTPQMQAHLDDFVAKLTELATQEKALRSARRTFATESTAPTEDSASTDAPTASMASTETVADTEAQAQTDETVAATSVAVEETDAVTDAPDEAEAMETATAQAEESLPPAEAVLDIPAEPAEETESHDAETSASDNEPPQEGIAEESVAEQQASAQTARLLAHPAVMGFIQTYLMSNEWFQVYTGSGNALRRLKGKDVNQSLGVVNFGNRTGELELFVPLSQLVQDLLEQRTRPVFENPTYNRALADLQSQLDSEATPDE